MIVSCNVRECKHNDGNGFCILESGLLIINYSDDGKKIPVCVDYENIAQKSYLNRPSR